MTRPDGLSISEETPEADVAEKLIPVEADDEADTWQDADHVTTATGWHANEADLIEQAIAVPDDDDFDRGIVN
jgi:hypothetical protein